MKLGNYTVGIVQTVSQRRPHTQVGTVVCHVLQFAYQFYCYPENEKHSDNEKLRERPCQMLVGMLALQLSGVSYHVSSKSFVLSFDIDCQCAPRLTADLQPSCAAYQELGWQ